MEERGGWRRNTISRSRGRRMRNEWEGLRRKKSKSRGRRRLEEEGE